MFHLLKKTKYPQFASEIQLLLECINFYYFFANFGR